jgi:hypothetical protein
MDDSILCGQGRDGKVGMAEFDRNGNNLAFSVSIDKFEAAVRLQGWTNVEAIFGTKVPRPARCWLGIDEGTTTNWPKWHLVEAEEPLKKFPRTDLRVESGLSEEIEGKFSLREKEVPKVRWKGCINAGQDCQEVVLECVNGVLHPIAVMHVWR